MKLFLRKMIKKTILVLVYMNIKLTNNAKGFII